MNLNRRFWQQAVPHAMEWGTYVFIILMFAGRLGTLRELGLYLPAALWLVRAVVLRRPGFEWRTPLCAVLVLFCLSGLISSLMSQDVTSSLLALKKDHLKLLILFAVIGTVFSEEEALVRLGRVLAAGGLLYLLAGGYRIGEDLLGRGQIDYEDLRYYATVYLYFLPPLFLQALQADTRLRALWAAGCVGLLSGIMLIGVRGAWVGLAGAAALWLYATRQRLHMAVTVRAAAAFAALTVLVVVVIFALFPAHFELIKGHTFQKLQMSMRIETWGNFLKLSGERPLLGHGPDDQAMSRHYREAFTSEKGTPPTHLNPTTPHNQFIRVLYEQGLVGLGLYLGLLALTFRTLHQAFRRGFPPASPLLPLAVASVVLGGYVLHCLFEDRSLTPLAVLIGIAAACQPQQRPD